MIGLVTGGFDPLHSGHMEYLRDAKKLCSHLVVGVNSDTWLKKKKGKYFMPLSERMAIVSELKAVDEVITFNDKDGSCLLYTSPSPRDLSTSRMPSSA